MFLNDPPEWAKYRATDATGEVHYFENRPIDGPRSWVDPLRGKIEFAGIAPDIASNPIGNWKRTLKEIKKQP